MYSLSAAKGIDIFMNRLQLLRKPIYFISIPNYFMGFILPIYTLKLGSSPIGIAMLFSVFSLLSILMRPFVGRCIDEKGRKQSFIIGLSALALSRLLFLIGHNYTYVFIARIVQSIGASFLAISLHTMISDISSAEDRSKNFGEVVQYGSKGAFLGSFIGFTILFSNIGENPFQLIFGIYFILSILALYLGVRDVKETITTKKEKKVSATNVIINKTFIKYLCVIGMLSLVNAITAPIFIIYLKDHITKDLGLISLMFIPSAILAMYLPAKLGKLADNYSRQRFMIIGLIIEAVFTILIPLATDYYIFIIIYTTITAANLMSIPAQRALVTEITGEDNRGKSYGLYNLAIGFGGIFGPLIGSSIYQYIDKNLVFFIEGIGLLVIVVFIGMFIRIGNKVVN